jgi:exonuclease SbcC
MEKMISSIAIRVALTNISSLPKSSMLIIDEGFGTLDDNNLEACARLLTNLKSYFKNILVISHVDTIKDIVDNVIDIGWEDGFAKVTCD